MSIIPADILTIMEKEYSDMCLHIIQEVCVLYNLDITDVKKKLGTKLSLAFEIDETKNNYRYVKRAPPKRRELVDDTKAADNICIANMFDFSLKTSRRCTRNRDIKADPKCLLCSVHLRMHYGNRLAYGVASEYQKEYNAFCALDQPIANVKPVAVKKQVIYKVK